MGMLRDADLAAFAQATGIKPASGEFRKALDKLQEEAFDLIRFIELERAGIRDGDGKWTACDPLDVVMRNMNDVWARAKAASA